MFDLVLHKGPFAKEINNQIRAMNALGGYIAIAEYAVFDSGTGESSDAHYATVFAKFKSATESRSTPSEIIPLTINVRLEDGRIVPLLNPEDLLPTSQARNLRVSDEILEELEKVEFGWSRGKNKQEHPYRTVTFFANNDFRDKGTLSNLIQQETNRRAKRAAEIKGKKEKQKPDRKEKADEKR